MTISILVSKFNMSGQIKCPRCGYQKDLKAMLKHFNRKTPCPAKLEDIDLNTIKDDLLKAHISKTKEEEKPDPVPQKKREIPELKESRISVTKNLKKPVSVKPIVVKSGFKIENDDDSELVTDSDSALDTDGESITFPEQDGVTITEVVSEPESDVVSHNSDVVSHNSDVVSHNSDVSSVTSSVKSITSSVKSIASPVKSTTPEPKKGKKAKPKRKTKAQTKLEEKQRKEFMEKRKEIRAKDVAKRKKKDDFVKAIETELDKEPTVTPDENSPEGIAVDMRSMIRFMHRRLQLIEQAFVSSQHEIQELRETNSILTQKILVIMSMITGYPGFIKNLPISKDIFPQHVSSMDEVDQDPMIKMRQDLKNFPPAGVMPKAGQSGFQTTSSSSYKYATVHESDDESDEET